MSGGLSQTNLAVQNGASAINSIVQIQDAAAHALDINADGSINVKTSSSAPTSLKFSCAYSNGAGASGTIATVTAGKTAYIIGAAISISGGTAQSNSGQILANGTSILGCVTNSTGTYPTSNSVSLPIPAGYGISVAATQNITWSATTNTNGFFAVWYIEV